MSHVTLKTEEIPLHVRKYHINRGYGVMYRQAWPWGTIDQHGLYFLAFSCSIDQMDEALNRMAGQFDGLSDSLFNITENLHSNYYYCPSQPQLKSWCINTLNKV